MLIFCWFIKITWQKATLPGGLHVPSGVLGVWFWVMKPQQFLKKIMQYQSVFIVLDNMSHKALSMPPAVNDPGLNMPTSSLGIVINLGASVVYKYYMVRGEVGRSIFPEVLATGLLPRTRRVRGNRPVASTEGKIDPLLPW